MAKIVSKQITPNLSQPITAQLIGQAIKARRTQSALKLDEAASLCGVAKQTFMRIEHGQEGSKLESILKICSGLGIHLQILPWNDEENINDWV